MADYIKHTQGKRVLFLVPVMKLDEQSTVYLDFSSLAKPANNKDRRNNYDPEKGPNFGIEVIRASEYAEFLRECNVHEKNIHQYNTRYGYTLFIENDA